MRLPNVVNDSLVFWGTWTHEDHTPGCVHGTFDIDMLAACLANCYCQFKENR